MNITIEYTTDSTISNKIIESINNGRLALPTDSIMKKWQGLELAIDVLSSGRNNYDGYQITANKNNNHICTILI
jgi:hypothetical protein